MTRAFETRACCAAIAGALLAAACSQPAGDGATAVPRDADPLALPIAAATRALVRGGSVDEWDDERRAFPHVDRFAWRTRSTVLSKDEIDRAWWIALERIAKNPRYADLRGELALEFEHAPFSAARLAELERYLGFARDGRLVPLGPNRDTRDAATPEPPHADEGLEEFAVVGTGDIELRHPETGALRIGAGTAMVLVLIPGERAPSDEQDYRQTAPNQAAPSFAPQRVRPFLLAKTEMTNAQRASASRDASESTGAPRTPWVVQTWQAGLDVLARFELRLPTQAEWQHAAQAGGPIPMMDESRVAWFAANSENTVHDVATLEPNPFGLYDVLGNVAELCADARAPGSGDAQSWLDLTRVARGGRATDESVSPNSRLELVLEDRPQSWIGLRPAYDIRPPPEPASNAKPADDAPPQSNEPVKKK